MVRVPLPLHLSQRKNLPFRRDAFFLWRATRDLHSRFASAVLQLHFIPLRTRCRSKVLRTFSLSQRPFRVRVPLPLRLSQRKNLPFRRDAFSLARHKGLTQPLRVCRPSAPFHSASNTLPLEGPQDLLPFAAALSGSSPSAPTLISKKKSPLSERCFFFGAPQGTRTPNLRIRSARLYPIELVALIGRFSRPVLENYTLLHHPVSKYISSHHHISLIIIHHYHKS